MAILMKRSLIFLLLIPACLFLCKRGVSHAAFSLQEITPHACVAETFPTRTLAAHEQREVAYALNQKFHYFGCGGQCFVFFSVDGRYVLKFPKQRRYTPPFFLHFLPSFLPYKAKKMRGYTERREKEFKSYQIALSKLPEKTGVLFVHFASADKAPAQNLLTLVGAEKEWVIDLHAYDFIVQRRAEKVQERILRLAQENNTSEIQKTFFALFQMTKDRCARGYHDTDPNLITNCGFIGERAVKIDIGHFLPAPSMQEPFFLRKAVLQASLPFREWLKTQGLDALFDAALCTFLEQQES